MGDSVIGLIIYRVGFPEPIVKLVKNDIPTLCNEIKASLAKMTINDTYSILLDANGQNGSKPYNLTLGSQEIYGDFMVVKTRGNDFKSIEDDEVFNVIRWVEQFVKR
jgi:hypothetical protein